MKDEKEKKKVGLGKNIAMKKWWQKAVELLRSGGTFRWFFIKVVAKSATIIEIQGVLGDFPLTRWHQDRDVSDAYLAVNP